MRPIILAALIVLGTVIQASAMTVQTMPPATYPESGTFCGLFVLCPKGGDK